MTRLEWHLSWEILVLIPKRSDMRPAGIVPGTPAAYRVRAELHRLRPMHFSHSFLCPLNDFPQRLIAYRSRRSSIYILVAYLELQGPQEVAEQLWYRRP